ncbi:hypothetical protein LTR70_006885 [Exophiala xenobiotica]|uniref:Uncharacterized protein n=1 Tax=Lithohypha guttulata TaxID=1690604 RepID=A0ABR0K624_9EURO|nr:hypothetical protein LTR24_006381 [Lithohypha guttulata]KAK5315146.1 hypothetical protein LTR70_006885 [Exophiala xenobiotica]
MADSPEDAARPFAKLINDLVVDYDSYRQAAEDIPPSSEQVLVPDSQPKFALKFRTAEACALFRAQENQRATELEEDVNTARTGSDAAIGTSSGTRELLDRYRGSSEEDVRKGALQKICQFFKTNPQHLADLLAMIEEVPGITMQGLDHVRQAIADVEGRNKSLESRCAILTREAVTYDTSLRVLHQALRDKTRALDQASSTDDKRTIQELRSHLLEAEKKRGRLESVAKNLLRTSDFEQVHEKLERLQSYDSTFNNVADELGLPADRRINIPGEVLKELKALCLIQRKYSGLERGLSATREALKAAQDENSRLQILESERNARDIVDTSSAEALKEAQSNASTRISALELDKQLQAHEIKELERKLVEAEQSRVDSSITAKQYAQQAEATACKRASEAEVTAKQHAQQAEATASKRACEAEATAVKQVDDARVVADQRITEVCAQAKLDIQQVRMAAAHEMQSAIDQNNIRHDEACKTLTAAHKTKLEDMEARHVKERDDLRALLYEQKERARAAQGRAQELETKNSSLALNSTSALASELHARYGTRRDVQLVCKLDSVLVHEEVSDSAWDMALLAFTTPHMMSVSFLTALAQKLESATDNEFWFAMAMLRTFVTECSLKNRQMPFATSMVVLRCIEILVTAQVDLNDVIERVEGLLDPGCLVPSMLKCINGHMEGQHISLSSEISSWRVNFIRHGGAMLIPDEGNKSLLVSDDTGFYMLRRHQFRFQYASFGLGIVMTDCPLMRSAGSWISLAGHLRVASSLDDGMWRLQRNNPHLEASDDSLCMRMDAEFLM